MPAFTWTGTICNFTLYWQFVPHCFSNIKITTTCNFRVNIFPSSPVLAGTIFGFELLSLVFTTIASITGCQMNCFCKNWRKTALPARRGRYAQLAESRLFLSLVSFLPAGTWARKTATKAARKRMCYILTTFPMKTVTDKWVQSS